MVQAVKDLVALGWYWVLGASGGVPPGRIPILTYHSVGLQGDPFFPSLSFCLFERQVRYLSRHFRFFSFGNFLERIRNGDPLPSRSAILTFDDGYKDNFRLVFPVLRKYAVPATIFLTTGSIGTEIPLWFDRLSSSIKNTSRTSLEWESGQSIIVLSLVSLSDRLLALSRIKEDLKTLSNVERLLKLDILENTLGFSRYEDLKDRMLNWDDIRTMDKEGIEMGGHTVSHPILRNLTSDESHAEIGTCIASIENHLQKKVRSFAYPNGTERDFNSETIDILKSYGVLGACTTIEGMASSWSQPYAVPRIYATDRNFYRFFWRITHLPVPEENSPLSP